MQDNFFKQLLTNGQLEGLISSMESILHEAKIKQPAGNFEAQKERIRVLREFQYEYLETIEENRLLNKKLFESTERVVRQTDILNKLMEENQALRKNIEKTF